MRTLIALPDRCIVRVAGPEGTAFLNGLLTIDPRRVGAGAPRPTALLTPQGKILHALWLYAGEAVEGAFRLEVSAAGHDDLIARLKRFRLRAKVEIEPVAGMAVVIDPEAAAPGFARRLSAPDANPIDAEAWRALRIKAGVPEQGEDYSVEDAFPAEVNLDLLGGVDFDKGCFVGQEVVSRMHRRASGGRKRALIVEAEQDLQPGQAVVAGQTGIGAITSAAGPRALACIRVDRWRAEGGAEVVVNGAPASISLPPYMPAAALNVEAQA